MLADSVGLALLVVLDTLTPAERLAFVLHDMFAVPFEEIAPMLGPVSGRDPAAGQPGPAAGAGRGRRCPTPDPARQREVVDAFFAAARDGDFDGAGRGARPGRGAAGRRRRRRTRPTAIARARAARLPGTPRPPGSWPSSSARRWSTARPARSSRSTGGCSR